MIIDMILDRMEDEKRLAEGVTHYRYPDGTLKEIRYDPNEFYRRCMQYGTAPEITYAMDYGAEGDVKAALRRYIYANNYDPEICQFINSVDWLGGYQYDY